MDTLAMASVRLIYVVIINIILVNARVLPRCHIDPSQPSCSSDIQCHQGYSCLNGQCCKDKQCPQGMKAGPACHVSPGELKCRPGLMCIDGICCDPTPPPQEVACLSGIYASNCTLQKACSSGYSCLSGKCCKDTVCPDGYGEGPRCNQGIALQECPNTNDRCVRGMCCQKKIEKKPNMTSECPGVKGPACSATTPCPTGFNCRGGTCCQENICQAGWTPGPACSTVVGQKRCPADFDICENGVCCKHPIHDMCPSGRIGPACAANTSCDVGYTCIRGYCCMDIVCPSNWTKGRACNFAGGEQLCPKGGFECVGQSCCRPPFYDKCPSRILGPKCSPSMKCMHGFSCIDGFCCKDSICPAGWTEGLTCNASPGKPYCRPGFRCFNGVCCGNPIQAMCPVQKMGPKCSPAKPCIRGYTCTNGYCCRDSLSEICPSGGVGPTCSLTQPCKPGAKCTDGYCCVETVQPVCPEGWKRGGICNSSISCAYNQMCVNGICCTNPISRECPVTDVGPTCSAAKPCKLNYICIKGHCCRSKQNKCPDKWTEGPSCGSTHGNDQCPLKHSCINGTCCHHPIANLCPSGDIGAKCSNTNPCQKGYTCLQGYCCRVIVCPNGEPAGPKCNTTPGQNPCMSGAQCFKDHCCNTRDTNHCPAHSQQHACPNVVGVQGCHADGDCIHGDKCCTTTCLNYCFRNTNTSSGQVINGVRVIPGIRYLGPVPSLSNVSVANGQHLNNIGEEHIPITIGTTEEPPEIEGDVVTTVANSVTQTSEGTTLKPVTITNRVAARTTVSATNRRVNALNDPMYMHPGKDNIIPQLTGSPMTQHSTSPQPVLHIVNSNTDTIPPIVGAQISASPSTEEQNPGIESYSGNELSQTEKHSYNGVIGANALSDPMHMHPVKDNINSQIPESPMTQRSTSLKPVLHIVNSITDTKQPIVDAQISASPSTEEQNSSIESYLDNEPLQTDKHSHNGGNGVNALNDPIHMTPVKDNIDPLIPDSPMTQRSTTLKPVLHIVNSITDTIQPIVDAQISASPSTEEQNSSIESYLDNEPLQTDKHSHNGGNGVNALNDPIHMTPVKDNIDPQIPESPMTQRSTSLKPVLHIVNSFTDTIQPIVDAQISASPPIEERNPGMESYSGNELLQIEKHSHDGGNGVNDPMHMTHVKDNINPQIPESPMTQRSTSLKPVLHIGNSITDTKQPIVDAQISASPPIEEQSPGMESYSGNEFLQIEKHSHNGGNGVNDSMHMTPVKDNINPQIPESPMTQRSTSLKPVLHIVNSITDTKQPIVDAQISASPSTEEQTPDMESYSGSEQLQTEKHSHNGAKVITASVLNAGMLINATEGGIPSHFPIPNESSADTNSMKNNATLQHTSTNYTNTNQNAEPLHSTHTNTSIAGVEKTHVHTVITQLGLDAVLNETDAVYVYNSSEFKIPDHEFHVIENYTLASTMSNDQGENNNHAEEVIVIIMESGSNDAYISPLQHSSSAIYDTMVLPEHLANQPVADTKTNINIGSEVDKDIKQAPLENITKRDKASTSTTVTSPAQIESTSNLTSNDTLDIIRPYSENASFTQHKMKEEMIIKHAESHVYPTETPVKLNNPVLRETSGVNTVTPETVSKHIRTSSTLHGVVNNERSTATPKSSQPTIVASIADTTRRVFEHHVLYRSRKPRLLGERLEKRTDDGYSDEKVHEGNGSSDQNDQDS